MKRTITFTALALVMATGFTSCRKCVVCTQSGADEVRVCEGDYDSNTEYGLVVDGLELGGYNCR